MKFCAIILSFLLCVFATPGYAGEETYHYSSHLHQVKTGVYALEGYNPGSNTINYRGTVEIQKSGRVYELHWCIGSSQRQYGIAIFTNNILSVSFVDCSGQDAGVVSYQLMDGNTFEGQWASFGSEMNGREVLKWTHE